MLVHQIGAANGQTKGCPELGLQGSEGHVEAVPSLIDVVADQPSVQIAGAPRHGLSTLVPDHGQGQRGECSPQERALHPLAQAGAFSLQQGEENAHRCPQRARQVSHGRAGDGGWPVARPGQVEQAGQACIVQVVSGPFTVGTFGPIAAQRTVDEAGIHLGQRLVSQIQAFHHAGAKAFQEYVGSFDEPQQDGPSLVRFEVQGEALFAAVKGAKEKAFAAFRVDGRHVAGPVAAAGTLDLDDLKAQVGQDAGAVGTGKQSG